MERMWGNSLGSQKGTLIKGNDSINIVNWPELGLTISAMTPFGANNAYPLLTFYSLAGFLRAIHS